MLKSKWIQVGVLIAAAVATASGAFANPTATSGWVYDWGSFDFSVNRDPREASDSLNILLNTDGVPATTEVTSTGQVSGNTYFLEDVSLADAGLVTETLGMRGGALTELTFDSVLDGHTVAAGSQDGSEMFQGVTFAFDGVDQNVFDGTGTVDLEATVPLSAVLTIREMTPLSDALLSSGLGVGIAVGETGQNDQYRVDLTEQGSCLQTLNGTPTTFPDLDCTVTPKSGNEYVAAVNGTLIVPINGVAYGGPGVLNSAEIAYSGFHDADASSAIVAPLIKSQYSVNAAPSALQIQNVGSNAADVTVNLLPTPEPGPCALSTFFDPNNMTPVISCADVSIREPNGNVQDGHADGTGFARITAPQAAFSSGQFQVQNVTSSPSVAQVQFKDFQGSAVVASETKQVAAIVNDNGVPPGDATSYSASNVMATNYKVTTSGNELTLPLVAKTTFGFSTAIVVQNATSSAEASVTIDFVMTDTSPGGQQDFASAFHAQDFFNGVPNFFQAGGFAGACVPSGDGFDCDGSFDGSIIVAPNSVVRIVSLVSHDATATGPGISTAYNGFDTFRVDLSSSNPNVSFELVSNCPPSSLDPVGGDVDGDGICDDGDASGTAGDASCAGGETTGCDDNCPLTANPSQADGDSDAVGDGCDNCTTRSNPRLASLESFQTATGGQLDDDADGFGNQCDAKFGTAGQVVGGVDLSQLFASFNKNRSGSNCGSAGDASCAPFDLDNAGNFISGGDITTAFQLFNQPPGPNCGSDCDGAALGCEGPACSD